jgi:protein-tyrosine phosphatase
MGDPSSRPRICFVCLGNICRSPTAEGVFLARARARGLGDAFEVDSAGIADYHLGARPDPRTIAHAARRGYELPSLARQIEPADLTHFDLILAMDEHNLQDLRALARRSRSVRADIRLFRAFDPAAPADAIVPDPYYGGPEGFEEVLNLCESAADGLLDYLAKRPS